MLRTIGIIVASFTLLGAFMALDRTVGHWYVPDAGAIRSEVTRVERETASVRSELDALRSDLDDLSGVFAPLRGILVVLDDRLDDVERCVRGNLYVEIDNFPYGYAEC